ncbi:cell division control protein 6 homolog [Pocillopora damicornis]|uniref:cell division control protein 6 homolog n=1 Tax=Pocillopora damicornis TaxID=46731 RepID=UPI000F5593E8|nr:cell division control protein 6 homolog [Pocillopora damicornis]
MPRITRSAQKQIEFRCQKTRSQQKKNEGTIAASRSKHTRECSISPRKRRDPAKACQTPVSVSPKKRKNNDGKVREVVSSDEENSDPKQKLSFAGLDSPKTTPRNQARCKSKNAGLKEGSEPRKIISLARQDGKKCQVIFVNCMALKQPQDIFKKIAVELVGEDQCPAKTSQKFLEEEFSSSAVTRILILDEMDQLESKHQEILYTMFEWPSLPKSKLILIGIANALDLTDRILPRLQARPKCKPELLHFAPYTKEQIVQIIKDRLTTVDDGNNILDASAVQFCARKVSAMAGDMRKALDICRRAVEVVESGERKQQILQPVGKAESPSKKLETPPKPKKVGISQIASVVAEVYGSRLVSGPGSEQPTIPLQQKLLICTFLLMTKERNTKEVVLGKFHDTYCKICTKRKVSHLGQEDFLGLCNILETRGLLGMKRAKDTRMMKVTLKIDEREVDYALQDKTLLSSILQEGMPTSSKK